MRGRLSAEREDEEHDRVRQLLQESGETHFLQFLEAWSQHAE